MALTCARPMRTSLGGGANGGRYMSRATVEADCRETLGLVPTFIAELPDYLVESEWQ